MSWIDIKDQKPQGSVLVMLERKVSHNYIHTAYYCDDFAIIGGRFAFDIPNVTHWQPLPEPPKGK